LEFLSSIEYILSNRKSQICTNCSFLYFIIMYSCNYLGMMSQQNGYVTFSQPFPTNGSGGGLARDYHSLRCMGPMMGQPDISGFGFKKRLERIDWKRLGWLPYNIWQHLNNCYDFFNIYVFSWSLVILICICMKSNWHFTKFVWQVNIIIKSVY